MSANEPQWLTLEQLADDPALVERLLARLREPALTPPPAFNSAI